MPTFRVEGADRQSGDDVAYDVEAESEGEARAQVESHMLISNIVQVMGSADLPPMYSPPPLSTAGSASPQGVRSPGFQSEAFQTQAVRSPAGPQAARAAPAYNLLNFAASACTALGIVVTCICLLVIAVGIFAMFASTPPRGTTYAPAAAVAGMAGVTSGISGIMAGVFLVGAGQSMAALRDIAINSFRR